MTEPSILQAPDSVSSRLIEAVDEAIGVLGHRLTLGEQPFLRVVDGEAMVDVLGGHQELDRNLEWDVCRLNLQVHCRATASTTIRGCPKVLTRVRG